MKNLSPRKPHVPRTARKAAELTAPAVEPKPVELPGIPLPGGAQGMAKAVNARLQLQKALKDQDFETLTSLDIRDGEYVIITRGENPNILTFSGMKVIYQPSNNVLTHFYRKNS